MRTFPTRILWTGSGYMQLSKPAFVRAWQRSSSLLCSQTGNGPKHWSGRLF